MNIDWAALKAAATKALENARGDELHSIQFSQGSSAYRLNQWGMASRYFSRSLLADNDELREQSHYNLGNTLFRSGWATLNPPKPRGTENPFLTLMRKIFSKMPGQQSEPDKPALTQADVQRIITYWQDAITHYQAALDISPDNHKAEHNRKEVEKLLKQLQDAKKQAEEESEDRNKEKPKQDDGEKKEDKSNGEDDGDGSKQDPDKNGQGEPKSKPDSDDRSDDGSEQHPNETDDDNQPVERREGESEEASAARILRELSDAETRPITRRNIRLRRPAKDW